MGEKIIKGLVLVAAWALLLMGYFVLFVSTYGIMRKVFPQILLLVFFWTWGVHFIYRLVRDFIEEELK